ncbi:MAG: HEAT repeat domain-containing protein [Planctomycetota bacterium]|nr:HEAT repeat domain-containing protein [Planctomycetota bacterium]
MSRCLNVVVSLVACAAPALAHGGQYRGPAGTVLPPVGRAGTGLPTPGPTTGARDLVPFSRTWQTWWEFNKEPFLVPQVRGVAGPVTGSDDFYLGPRRGARTVDVLKTTDADRTDKIVPALAALIDRDRNRDVQSACLVALGKIGKDGRDADGAPIDLEELLSARIQRENQEVRETAVLALGIAGSRDAFGRLRDLFGDTSAGRKLAGRAEVRKRTRAYAAYGLGLLARRVGDPKLAQQVYEVLWPALLDDDYDDRDLKVAIVSAIGVLRADVTRSADKRLAWAAAENLASWFARDLGPTEESLQAHAPVAIARLLGRGTSRVHRRVKEQLAATLNARKRRGAPILQSCAIALGRLAAPAEAHAEDAVFSEALREHYAAGRDQTAKQLAAISLGRIGGASNREFLVKAYGRAPLTLKPWAAIGLGLQARRKAAAGTPDVFIGELLLDDLEDAGSTELRSALAVAVGLAGLGDAAPTMLRLLREHEGDEWSAGYLAIGLGLLQDGKAAETLAEIMARSTRRPFLLQQCAVALGMLGDQLASDQLMRLLEESESQAVLAAVASAIGRIGDRRAIDRLVALTADKELTKISRAFVAAALGGVADKDTLPWNVPLSVDVNYATGIDTMTNGTTGVLDIL